MDGRIEAMLREHLPQQRLVAQIAHHQRHTAPGDRLDPRQRLAARIHQAVVDHHLEARLQQLDDGVRADIAGAAGDQDAALFMIGRFFAHVLSFSCRLEP